MSAPTAPAPQGFSETVSENQGQQRRGRGRPPVFDPVKLMEAAYMEPNAKTRRQHQNILYRQRGLLYVTAAEDPALDWLANIEKMAAGEPHAWKPGILAELGRIKDPLQLYRVALEICELRPKTKDAVEIIRRMRTGKAEADNRQKLMEVLARALDAYIGSHPRTTDADVKGALRVLLSVNEMESEPADSYDDEGERQS